MFKLYHSVKIQTFPAVGSGSLTFDMYKDFYMVPTALPVIASPGIKTKTIDIPGANGAIDLTESLTPYPLYKNRTGSLEFAVLLDRYKWYSQHKGHGLKKLHAHDTDRSWAVLYSDLANKIHGRRCRLFLEDDPNWYYEGRIAVNAWKTSNDGKWPVVTLNYDLAPYKLSRTTSIEDSTSNSYGGWKWDPFSFIDGVIYPQIENSHSHTSENDGLFKNIIVNSDDYVDFGIYRRNSTEPVEPYRLYRDVIGFMPVCPTITIQPGSTGMGVAICGDSSSIANEPELGYFFDKIYGDVSNTAKSFTDPECILYDYLNNGLRFMVKGHGTMSISFRKGSL